MLDYTISDHEISVPGCDLVQNDRHRNGGGVVLYIRNYINFIIRHELMIDSLELLSVEIFKPKVKSFIIINKWYRLPNSLIDIVHEFELCIHKMDTENREIILIVDFNCDWNLPLKQRQAYTNKLANITNAYQLEQIFKEPTRVTENPKSLIDLIFSNKSS